MNTLLTLKRKRQKLTEQNERNDEKDDTDDAQDFHDDFLTVPHVTTAGSSHYSNGKESGIAIISNILRKHQRKDSMEDKLLQPIKPAQGVITSYGSVPPSEEDEEYSELRDGRIATVTREHHRNHTSLHPQTSLSPQPSTSSQRVDNSSLQPQHSEGGPSANVTRHHSFARDSISKGRSHSRQNSKRSTSGTPGEGGEEGHPGSGGRRPSGMRSRRTSRIEMEELKRKKSFSLKPILLWFFLKGRKILVKYWIWMVALMLMIMSVSGERVVVFRICYMAFFLLFILTFQLSYRLWRRFLFPFLLTVMLYSLFYLTVLYSYQFTAVRRFWRNHLMVSDKLQSDLGLVKYEHPWTLFVELFTPTFFIVITFIQLKSFHKEFMDLTRDDDLIPSSSGNASSTTRRTTLPTLQEETEVGTASSIEHPNGGRKTSLKRGRSVSLGEEGQKQYQQQQSFEVKIDMSGAVDGGDKVTTSMTPPLASPSKLSERSVEFAPLQTAKRSITGISASQESGKSLSRRKTLTEIGPVKIDNIRAADIRTAATSLWDTAKPGINELYELFWRFLEIHMMKVVYTVAFYIAVKDISAVNFVYVFFTSIALPLARYEKLVTTIFSVWSATLILSKMLYQLSVAEYFRHESNCSYVYFAPTPNAPNYRPFNSSEDTDYRTYLGFEEVTYIFPYIGKYLFILLIIIVHSVVTLRQRIHRQRFGLPQNPSSLLFMGIDRKSADKGFIDSIKFLLNYGFYKFGVEVTLLSIIVLIGTRMDIMSVVFSFWLYLLSLLRRRTVQCLWPFFTVFVTTIVPIEYLLSLGIPSFLCIEYPWYTKFDPELRNWLFLPDFRIPPNGFSIFYDFIVLLLACRQWLVFNSECITPPQGPGGGSNDETFYETQDSKSLKSQREEVPDFFTFSKTVIDHLKSYFFSCFYWMTLAVVFLTATGRTNLFGLGYILGCFFFLWNGSEFYLKPIKSIVRTWKCIIAYCATVIFLKTVLHVVGCVESDILLNSVKWCWISKLFGISCQYKLCRTADMQDIEIQPISQQSGSMKCPFTETTPGLLLDGVCFCFLLIQKRIFGSFYFTYLVKDIKAQQVLASRGAELIHEIQAKEVMEQEDAERDVMEKIKMKMDKIRAYQKELIEQGKGRLPPDRKSHRQVSADDYAAISPYSTREGSMSRSPIPGEEELPHTLPTVYSPTPSLPTLLSPSSAVSHHGKGYLEVYRVRIDQTANVLQHIDQTAPSSPTIPSMSFASSPEAPSSGVSFHSPPHIPFMTSPEAVRKAMRKDDDDLPPIIYPSRSGIRATPPVEHIPPMEAFISRPSFRLHQKPSHPICRVASFRRKMSTQSTVASHGSVRSGDMFNLENDPALDDLDVDLEEKPRKSLIPDPEGDELRRLANSRGLTAFVSQFLKGDLYPPLGPYEYDFDVGESSKDSAIVSVDREREEPPDPDASMVTIVTTIPVTTVSSPKASTSRGEEGGEGGGEEEEEAKDSKKEKKKKRKGSDEPEPTESEEASSTQKKLPLSAKLFHWCTIFCWFVESCVISLTAKLNHVSRDYRYVSRRLSVEKRALKLLFEMEENEGATLDPTWKRTTLEKISRATVPRTGSSESFRPRRPKPEFGLGPSKTEKRSEERDHGDGEGEEDATSETYLDSNAFIRLFRSLFYTVVSQSEYACYTMVIINQMTNASLLSLPLPIMVFLWGCMSVPRPSKTFWISLITYTEAVVVAKYIFNFSVWPWTDFSDWNPQVIKNEDSNKNANISSTHLDLALLLILFFHRFMLKSLGLWDLDDSLERGRITVSPQNSDDKLDKRKNKKKKVNNQQMTTNDKGNKKKDEQAIVRRRKVNTHDPPEQEITPEDESNGDELSGSNGLTSSGSYEEEERLCEENIGRLKRFGNATLRRLNDCKRPVEGFYHRLLHPPFRISHDLYTLMFVCDFINFFIVVFAFNAFGSSTGESITKYFEDNKVPIPFLLMIMAQFCSMVTDRALYLRKNIKLRVYFHIALVIIIHFWLFFALPSVTERKFTELNPPKAWYVFKCIYLLLSAIQVKGGYPTRILGNTFTKKYSYINLYFFKGYMLVPFLYDLRLIMDWIWTDTSLELDEWSIMEDIFKNLFQRKCELQFQANFPQFRGYPRQMYTKYMLGGAYLIMIIGAIWFPLVIFAVGGTVGTPNRPMDVSVEMEISGYVPIAKITATKVNDSYLSESQYQDMLGAYKTKKEAVAFLSNSGYDYLDTSVVLLNGNSTPVWGISPPSKNALIADLKRSIDNEAIHKMDFRVSIKISRHKTKAQSMDSEVMKNYDVALDKPSKESLLKVLDGKSDEPIKLQKVFPNFLRVPEKAEPEMIRALELKDHGFRDIEVRLKNLSAVSWFEVQDICTKDNDPYYGFFRKDGSGCDYVLMMLINEKVFPGALQVVSGYGILGLYTTFVFVVSRLIRSLFDDVSFKVIYTQMPNVDRVLQLCLDIYLVRESHEFTLEEDLYAKLLYLYRSPETLIKWTKQCEEDQFEKQHIVVPTRE